jgi:cobalamin-dependent methionine synthase I
MVMLSDGFNINKDQVFRDIGYAPNFEPSARMISLVNDYVDNAHNLTEPSYSHVTKDIKSVQGSRAVLEDFIVFESEVIARLLERARKVAVFTLTIGNRLENTAAQLARDGLILQAAVLDAVGSGIAEKLADFVQDRLGDLAHAQGLTISRRFSPGYCDWNVSQQKMVFKAMNGDFAGVNLTDGCLMLPRKSISGIIGIGPREMGDYNPCTTCDKQDCVGRR